MSTEQQDMEKTSGERARLQSVYEDYQYETGYEAGRQAERERILGLIGEDEATTITYQSTPLHPEIEKGQNFTRNALRKQFRKAITKPDLDTVTDRLVEDYGDTLKELADE